MSCFVCGDKPVAQFRDRFPFTEVDGHTVHRGCARELEHAIEAFADVAAPKAWILRWASNNNVPPRDLRELWCKLGLINAEQAEESEAAYQRELAAFLADYRANPPQRSAEEIAEMRAAFGPGETVVDIITGERFEL